LAAPSDLRLIVNFMISLVLVLAIQVFSGNSGIVSFGHVSFMGIGAYVAAIVTISPQVKADVLPALPSFLADRTMPFLPAVLFGGIVGAVVACVIGLVLARMRERAMAMATIGVLVIFFVLFDNWEAVTRGNTGIAGIPRSTTVYSALAFSVLAIAASRAFRESRAGLQLRGSRTDPVAAGSLGANLIRLRWLAWTLSGGIMGVGGALWAQYNIAVGPGQFFFETTFLLLAMLVLGGLGSVSGAVVGVVIVTAVSELMRRVEAGIGILGLGQIVVALLIIVVLLRRPDGVMGVAELDDVIERFWRRRGGSRASVPPPDSDDGASPAGQEPHG
jgi:branched-chain amino acid transport system permease protein